MTAIDYRPLSGREQPRFAAVKTFFRLPHVPLDAGYDLGILGVPFDGGVSYRPGARFAPTRVREASALGRGFHWARGYSWVERLKVADLGDCPTVPLSIDQTYARIEAHLDEILGHGKRVLAVGGDHSITLPLLRAVARRHGRVRLIHFDAHLDTYPAAWGCEYHHGAFVRHAVDEGLVDPATSIQIGIRGPLAAADDLAFVERHGIRVCDVDAVRGGGGLDAFLATLPRFDATPTYLSFDIDCLDPAYAPGTGTPVPGGLTTYEVQRILRALRVPRLVGADLVEVCPAYDPSEITALAAVDVLNELICLMSESPHPSPEPNP